MKTQKERISKISIIGFVLIFLTACASTRERFPDYGEVAKKNTTVPVVLDLFVYRDIAGKSRGVDSELTQRSIDNAISKIEEKLAELGYKTKMLATLNGLSYDVREGKKYLIAEGWKSNGEPYQHLNLEESTNAWHTKENKKFLNALKRTARKINARANIDQSKAENKIIEHGKNNPEEQHPLLSELTVPSVIGDNSENDIVMFVLVEGFFQSTGKYLGQSLLIGGVSAALTGGTIIGTGSGTHLTADIIVFDKKAKKVLWHGMKTGTRKYAVGNAIGSILRGYPNTDGKTVWDRKKYRNTRTKESKAE